MDEWHALDIVTEAQQRRRATRVTPDGAAWLASASAFPRAVRASWAARPTAPGVLPCGTLFDVVNLPALFGRRVLDQLWAAGPGSGPVAVHRGRVLLLVTPGTAQRLPALLDWEEWAAAVPAMLCHGTGDAVTVPPLHSPDPDLAGEACTDGPVSRWVVAPDSRRPWLPGADHLLWACLRAARATPGKAAPSLVRAPERP
ncbi:MULTISPECIES: bifunctional DNA primase/polymerase [unclassified Streptomyces]|uniref:bifunctional DNA primase/polymerase n=1 Tax=unclassified Streptomyces TaxID=2593676 RepID=UPI001F2E6E68|nr:MULTISPECIES: bifunctional DNA primase/polymerase [unclassified Streptomyces]